jgi:hypothetical protein
VALSTTLDDMTSAPIAPGPPAFPPPEGTSPVAPVPPPPQGPGVYPPFPTAPTEGRNRRIGLGLGIGGAVLVLVCGGGIAGVIGLVTVMSRALTEQAHVVVGQYFEDVRAKRYNEAYDAQCQEAKDRESRSEFASRVAEDEPIVSYRVGDFSLADINQSVPVDVTYDDGDTGQLSVYLSQSTQTGRFQVCGVEE